MTTQVLETEDRRGTSSSAVSAPALSPLRIDRITASRLPAVLGISPYETRSHVLREMVRQHFGDTPEFAGNLATEWGNAHEADAIAEYELTTGTVVHRHGRNQETVVHPTVDFLAATPDGWATDRVVECKSPWRARYVSIAERPDYEAQVRLQMAMRSKPFGDLVIWRPDQPLIIETIERDSDWLPSVLPQLEQFMGEYFLTIGDPALYGPHREPLTDQRTDAGWIVQAREWMEIDYLIRQFTAERDRAADALKALSPGKAARGGGVDLLRFERKGAVQYRKALAALGIAQQDLEAFRGNPLNVASVRRLDTK